MKYNFNRKGVSTIVANVLIILLVVVGVALIWAAVKPSIESGTEGIQSDCFTAQVETTQCVNAAANTWKVTVKRNPGAGALTGLKFRFENAAGTTTEIKDQLSVSLAELESKEYTPSALTQLLDSTCIGSASGACTGTTSTACTGVAGCIWSGSACSGTVTACDQRTTSTICGTPVTTGCTWNANNPPAKVSVAALVGTPQKVCDIISSPTVCV